MAQPNILRPLLFALLAFPARAHALPGQTSVVEPADEHLGAPIGVGFSVDLSVRLGDGRDAIGGFALLSIPLDVLWRRAALAQPVPQLKPAPRATRSEETAPAPPADATPPAPEPQPPQLPVRVTRALARATVEAALRHAGLNDSDGRIVALASRARSSALLPELRLRAMRQIDATENLAPTEYDPERVTATGGTSTWLEARATWRLDRLVFADDEVPLERMRNERADARARLTARVIELLAAWQRARMIESDPSRAADDRVEGMLKALETEAALDVVTGGAFRRPRSP